MTYIKHIALKEPGDPAVYPFSIPAVQHLQKAGSLPFRQPVTFFVGENGTGKSTLLEAIAVSMGFNAEGGSRDFYFSTKNTHSSLYRHLSVARSVMPQDGFFLRAESFYNTASYLEENSTMLRYGGASLHAQSHGESFLALVVNRFGPGGLYLLDEPEAALSPQRLLSLLICIHDLVKQNCQFIISTHSPILMAYPGAEILQFSEAGIESVAYRETEHYKLTRQFMDAPEQMMKYLLEE